MKENENISFEDKIKNAKEILEKLTKSDITLSDSLKLYNEGLEELKTAQKLLEEAKLVFSEKTKN